MIQLSYHILSPQRLFESDTDIYVQKEIPVSDRSYQRVAQVNKTLVGILI